MTVKQIVSDYLTQNGFDGLHSHPENNNYGGCGCGIVDVLVCQECTGDCEPAYAHTLIACKRCPDFEKCEPEEIIMYCGKKII